MKPSLFPIAILACMAVAPLSLAAQAATAGKVPPAPAHARITWVDDARNVTVTDSGGIRRPADIGSKLAEGTRIRTAASTLELQLVPNGSVIRLAANTTFTLANLGSPEGQGDQRFDLVTGKLRMVAAKLGRVAVNYEIRTPTAVAAVRGTDFARQYDPALKKDWLCVLEGLIDFSSTTSDAAALVSGGQFVSLAKGFSPQTAPQDWLDTNLADLMGLHTPLPGDKP